MRAHVFRLTRGQDLRAGIETYAREHGIAAGCALSGVGCVLRARVRDASGVTVRQIDEPMEIVSLTGTVSAARTHLHVAFSRGDLSTVGGHLLEGCTVNTTAEIVLLELPGLRFGAAYDPQTGYDELEIVRDE